MHTTFASKFNTRSMIFGLLALIVIFLIGTPTPASAQGGRIIIIVKAKYEATLKEPPNGLPVLEFSVTRTPYVEDIMARRQRSTDHSVASANLTFSRDNVDARFYHILLDLKQFLEIEGPGRQREIAIAFDDFRRMVHQAAVDQVVGAFGLIALDTGFKILGQFTGGLSYPRQLLITTLKEFVTAYLKGGDIQGLEKAALNETIGMARKLGVSDENLNTFLDAVMLARSAIENWLKDMLKIQSITIWGEDSNCSWHVTAFWDARTGDFTAYFTKQCGDPESVDSVNFNPGSGKPGDNKTINISITNIQGAPVVIDDITLNGLDAVMEDGANYIKNGLGTPAPSVTFTIAKPRKDGIYPITGMLRTARNENVSVRGNFTVENVGPKIEEISPEKTSADPGENMTLSATITLVDDNADKNNPEEVRARSINLTGHPAGLNTSKNFRKADTVNRTNHDAASGTYTFILSRDGGDVDDPHEHDVFSTSIRISDDNGLTDENDIELEVNDVKPEAIDFKADPTYVHSRDGKTIKVTGKFVDGNGADDIVSGLVDCSIAGGEQYYYRGQPALNVDARGDDFIQVSTPDWNHTDDEGTHDIPVEVEDEKEKGEDSTFIHVGNFAPDSNAWGHIWGGGIGVRPEQSKLLCPNDPFKVGIIVNDKEGDTFEVKATIVETGQTVVLEREPGNVAYTGEMVAPPNPGNYTIRYDAVETDTVEKKPMIPKFNPLVVDPCADRRVTGVDLAGGANLVGGQALMIKVAGPPGASLDEILVKIPKKSLQGASAGSLPEGWTMSTGKENLVFSGPKTQTPCHLRVDLSSSLPNKADVDVMLDGNRLLRKKGFKVAKRPPVRLSDNFDNILKFPSIVSPGEQIEFMPLDLEKTPSGGKWVVSGRPAVEIPGKGRYVAALPDSLIEGEPISLSYTDPYGIEFFKSDALPDIQIVPPIETEFPFILDVTEFAFAGDLICVCGSFPNLSSRNGLLLDSQSLASPVSASSHIVVLRLPKNTKPGTLEVGGNQEAGYSQENKHPFTVIEVQGFIDQNIIRRGGSTELTLTVVGTDEVLQLELTNSTPNIIALDGGDHQVIPTSGGANNKLERTVTGIKRGDFVLDYKLVLDFCPCREK